LLPVCYHHQIKHQVMDPSLLSIQTLAETTRRRYNKKNFYFSLLSLSDFYPMMVFFRLIWWIRFQFRRKTTRLAWSFGEHRTTWTAKGNAKQCTTIWPEFSGPRLNRSTRATGKRRREKEERKLTVYSITSSSVKIELI